MKLISIKQRPELKERFCNLSQELLSEKEKAFALKPEYVAKILDLNFPVVTEAFLLENKQGIFVGRILLQGSVLDGKLGHWGLFVISSKESDQKEFLEAWEQIEGWFKDHSIKKVIGPYLFTTYFPYRFRIDERPESYGWEPNQPRRDYELFKKLGHEVDQLYFTNFIDGLGIFATKGAKELEEAQKQGFSFREVSKANLEQDIRIIYDLSMASFTENYLFAPIPFELFRNIYIPSFRDLDVRLSCLLFSLDHRPIGFNFTFVSDDQIVIKSVSVLPEFRGKGLLNAEIRWSMLKAQEHYPQVKKISTALIHEDNGPSKHVANESKDKTRHEYVLLKKDLP